MGWFPTFLRVFFSESFPKEIGENFDLIFFILNDIFNEFKTQYMITELHTFP